MNRIKPWSTSDMVENASNWSLAGDVGLLGYLEQFSEEFLSKANETNKNLTALTTNLDNACISLDLVKKQFNSLHNTQFVESRVYEDDYSSSAKSEELEVTGNDLQDNRIVDWNEAIRKGVEVVKANFEKVEVPGSDSEDETDFPSYVLRPKNPYADRPLPHIIGSDQWYKHWHVGMLDSSSESEEENVAGANSSESDSEHTNANNRVGDNDTSHNLTAKHPIANSTFGDTVNNSVSNENTENNNSLPVQAPVSTDRFAHELARKLGHVIQQNPSIVEPEVNRKPIQSYKPKYVGNLFDDEPPPLDSNDDLFGDVQKGLFSGGSGLFDDIPEEHDWNQGKKVSTDAALPTQKLPNLFSDDEDDDDLFTGITQSKPKPFTSDNHDLFTEATPKPLKKSYLPSPTSSSLPYFESEPPALIPDSKPVDKKPIGGVKILGATDIRFPDLKPTPKKTDDPSIKTGLFDSLKNVSINSCKVVEQEIQEPETQNTTKPLNLFDDTDDLFEDDLFSTPSVKKFTSDLFSDEDVSSIFAQDNKTTFHEDLGFLSPKNSVADESSVYQSTINTSNVPEVDKPSNLSIVTQNRSLSINVDLFDERPPALDGAWDSAADHLFDDHENLFDSTSVIGDHQSGLFDNEPPSLFSESSGIIRDMSATRVETDDSFNPFASSSRRFSADIFNEQQSNDSFFVTKNRSTFEQRTQSTLDRISENTIGDANNPALDDASASDFDGISSVNSKMNTNDFLPSLKDSSDALYSTEDPSKFDETSETPPIHEAPPASSSSLIKPVLPGKLKHNLNINVGALKPGAGIITKKDVDHKNSSESNTAEKSIDESDSRTLQSITKDRAKIPVKRRPSSRKARQEAIRNSIADFRLSGPSFNSDKNPEESHATKIEPGFLPKIKQESGGNSFMSSGLFDDIPEPIFACKETKGLKSGSLDDLEHEKHTKIVEAKGLLDDAPIPKFAHVAEENLFDEAPIFLPNERTSKGIGLFNDSQPSVSHNASSSLFDSSPVPSFVHKQEKASKPTKVKSLFDDEADDFDDLFGSAKLPSKSNVPKQSLFGDDSDEDDIFGDSGLSNTKSSAAQTKKQPKSSQITKLENTAVVEDPLSLFQD